MSHEPATRHMARDELSRSLAQLRGHEEQVIARPIRVASEPQRAAPHAVGERRRETERLHAPSLRTTRADAAPSPAASRELALPSSTESVEASFLPPRLKVKPWWVLLLALPLLVAVSALSWPTTERAAPPPLPHVSLAPPSLTPLPQRAEPVVEPSPAPGPGPGSRRPETASPKELPVLRRRAVDALMTGRTRAALETYRELLRAQPALDERPAIEEVIRQLERELQLCEEEAGTPCGL